MDLPLAFLWTQGKADWPFPDVPVTWPMPDTASHAIQFMVPDQELDPEVIGAWAFVMAHEAMGLKGGRSWVVDATWTSVDGGLCGGLYFAVRTLDILGDTDVATSLQEVQKIPMSTGVYEGFPVTAWKVGVDVYTDGDHADFMRKAKDAVW